MKREDLTNTVLLVAYFLTGYMYFFIDSAFWHQFSLVYFWLTSGGIAGHIAVAGKKAALSYGNYFKSAHRVFLHCWGLFFNLVKFTYNYIAKN